MSQKRMKLILRNDGTGPDFRIVKVVNTLNYGKPGDIVTKSEAVTLLQTTKVAHGLLVVEFIEK